MLKYAKTSVRTREGACGKSVKVNVGICGGVCEGTCGMCEHAKAYLKLGEIEIGAAHSWLKARQDIGRESGRQALVEPQAGGYDIKAFQVHDLPELCPGAQRRAT